MNDTHETAPDDEVEVLAPGTVIAIVDPLCGWCWGAAPALSRIAATGVPLEVVGSGLFIGDRPMTAEFADYAWKNDQRIQGLTGQSFSEVYRERVLGDRDGRIDSGPATLALAAVQLHEREKALGVLHALQRARFVEGLDVTAEKVVAEVLERAGIAATTIAAFLAEDDAVIEALNQRAEFARELLGRFGARGVPTLVRVTETGAEKIEQRLLYEDLDGLAAAVGAA